MKTFYLDPESKATDITICSLAPDIHSLCIRRASTPFRKGMSNDKFVEINLTLVHPQSLPPVADIFN